MKHQPLRNTTGNTIANVFTLVLDVLLQPEIVNSPCQQCECAPERFLAFWVLDGHRAGETKNPTTNSRSSSFTKKQAQHATSSNTENACKPQANHTAINTNLRVHPAKHLD